MKKKTSKSPLLLDSVATGFVKEFRTFGIGVAVGLAPFFGDIPIPGFRPLIKVFPTDVKVLLLTIAPFLLGWVAATVKFYLRRRPAQAKLKRLFGISSAVVVAAVFGLLYLHNFYLVEVKAADGPKLVIVGGERLRSCSCSQSDTDEVCIKKRRFNLVPCWRERDIKAVRIAFELDYLLLNLGFGVVVGVLRLDRPQPSRVRRQGSSRRATNVSKSSPAQVSAEPQELVQNQPSQAEGGEEPAAS